jgi:hypothetical protein
MMQQSLKEDKCIKRLESNLELPKKQNESSGAYVDHI